MAYIKKLIFFTLAISMFFYGLPGYAQEIAQFDRDIQIDMPLEADPNHPDPNQVIKDSKEGKIIPEQIKPLDDECADELNRAQLETGRPPVSDDYKQKCPQKNQHKKPKVRSKANAY